jgi:uncharacterized protein (UPF0276 family)
MERQGGSTEPLQRHAGVGLKLVHAGQIISEHPPIACFEVHPENFMVEGGPRLAALDSIRAQYPVSLHGVALSLGGAERLDRDHLQRLKHLIERYQPLVVSEHIAWSRHQHLYVPDLLPIPMNDAALQCLCNSIDEAQTALGQRILIENPSSYLKLPQSDIPEQEFMVEAAQRSGCGLLLDVNNVYVSSVNLAFDAQAYLDSIPADLIAEIHLAGHSRDAADSNLLIDDHGSAVPSPVWSLYRRLIARTGPRFTIVEWDNNIPSWAELSAQADLAERAMQQLPSSRFAA